MRQAIGERATAGGSGLSALWMHVQRLRRSSLQQRAGSGPGALCSSYAVKADIHCLQRVRTCALRIHCIREVISALFGFQKDFTPVTLDTILCLYDVPPHSTCPVTIAWYSVRSNEIAARIDFALCLCAGMGNNSPFCSKQKSHRHRAGSMHN